MSATRTRTAPYRHTQFGTVIVLSLLFAVAGTISLSFLEGVPDWTRWIGVLIAVALVLFFDLTAEIDETSVRLRFGIGLIRRSVPLAAVASCRAVRNTVLMGWGIHYIGRGWLYNVSGMEAVEIQLKDGTRLRIGTDDPEGLLAAIRDRLADPLA